MASVDFAEAARQDVNEIARYLEDHGGYASASNFSTSLGNLKQRLESHPKASAIRSSLGPAVRVAVLSPYLILHQYLDSEDQVVVLRVVHERRNVTKDLLRGR